MRRDKLLILFMFTAAAMVAGFAIWYRHQQSSIVLQRMPPGVAALIAYAPQAEIQRLVPEEEAPKGAAPAEVIRLAGHSYWVIERKDTNTIRDFSTVRGWFIHNDNFDWNPPSPDRAGPWQYGMLFSNGADKAQLLLDIPHRQLLLTDGTILNTGPMIEGLKSFFAEQFPPAKDGEKKTEGGEQKAE
jgi:hypothetical protein